MSGFTIYCSQYDKNLCAMGGIEVNISSLESNNEAKHPWKLWNKCPCVAVGSTVR